MNRNQKIAIGCGGAGCLGLLVLAVVAAGLYFYYQRRPPTNSRIRIDSNRSSNTNSSNTESSDTNSSNSSEETPSSSMSNDDKHKLFQAAGMAGDTALTLKVLKKIGFGMGIGSEYGEFVKDHISWSLRNPEFMSSVDTPEKARAYVEAHLDD